MRALLLSLVVVLFAQNVQASEVYVFTIDAVDPKMRCVFRSLNRNIEATVIAVKKWKYPEPKWEIMKRLRHPTKQKDSRDSMGLGQIIAFNQIPPWKLDYSYEVTSFTGGPILNSNLSRLPDSSKDVVFKSIIKSLRTGSSFSRKLKALSEPRGEFLEVALFFQNREKEQSNTLFTPYCTFSSGPGLINGVSVIAKGRRIFPSDFLTPRVAGGWIGDSESVERFNLEFVSELSLTQKGELGFKIQPFKYDFDFMERDSYGNVVGLIARRTHEITCALFLFDIPKGLDSVKVQIKNTKPIETVLPTL